MGELRAPDAVVLRAELAVLGAAALQAGVPDEVAALDALAGEPPVRHAAEVGAGPQAELAALDALAGEPPVPDAAEVGAGPQAELAALAEFAVLALASDGAPPSRAQEPLGDSGSGPGFLARSLHRFPLGRYGRGPFRCTRRWRRRSSGWSLVGGRERARGDE